MKQHLCDHIYTYDASDGNSSYQATDFYPFGYAIDRGWAFLQPYKFGGKELDDMHGLQMYDQGARFFGADLPITWSMDPLLEKYYSMSPYCQMGNNPVMNMDLKGDSISVFIEGQVYYWLKIDNEYALRDADGVYWKESGNYRENLFVRSFIAAMRKLHEKSAGDRLVRFLAESERNLEIRNRKENKADDLGRFIYWDDKNKGWDNRPGFVGLGHELAHIEDIWKGTADMKEWFSYRGGDGKMKSVLRGDIYAMHIENLIREEHGLDTRTHYLSPREDIDNRSLFAEGVKDHQGVYQSIFHFVIPTGVGKPPYLKQPIYRKR